MDEGLLAEVLGRLDTDQSVDDEAGFLVFAACTGEAELDAVLGGAQIERPDLPDVAEQPEPTGAYLQSISVEGFRGIGPRATLTLAPGPGLTIVAGRNGSGKSSFAEALELILTGDNYRWSNRSKAWREGWRNLHHDGAARIVAGLAEEGVAGDAVVTGSWKVDDDLDGLDVVVQRTGQPKSNLDALGWTHDLVAFRPFLSYNELGSMLDEGPSKLYDALKAILGLDALTVAGKRLADARLARENHFKGRPRRSGAAARAAASPRRRARPHLRRRVVRSHLGSDNRGGGPCRVGLDRGRRRDRSAARPCHAAPARRAARDHGP